MDTDLRLDETIAGGYYLDADGNAHDANGKPLDKKTAKKAKAEDEAKVEANAQAEADAEAKSEPASGDVTEVKPTKRSE